MGPRLAQSLARSARIRYWGASVLPALVGTTLPFWLRPPGFSFRWLAAVEFLAATVLCHAGFSFLHEYFESRPTVWPRRRLIVGAIVCIVAASLLGLHLNATLPQVRSVPGYIFIVYGLSALFAGVLYAVPPFDFRRRAGGEIVLCYSLALLPGLGAYLVQVGDLTRKVYLVLLPLIVVTALWVWTDELVSRIDDEAQGRQTLVVWFGSRFSGTLATLAISVMFYATFLVMVVSAAASPWTLTALLLSPLVWRIATLSWREHDNPEKMLVARSKAITLHWAASFIIAVSPLLALVF